MKISFPEVDVQVWEKMMKLLEPGGLTKTPMFADLLEVLPFYDKYQFSAGLRICDVILSDFLTVFLSPESRMWHTYRSADDAHVVKMVTMGHRLNLPQSKNLAVEYAGSRLKYILSCKEQVITDLLPLVENDAEILVAMVSTVLGKKSKDMTVDEMREFTRRNGFAEQCIGMHKQIQEIDRQMRQFGDIMTIRVQSQIEEFSGEYESLPASEFDPKYKRFLSRLATSEGTHCGGAMKYGWVKHAAGFRRYVIESVDVFGNEWQMSIIVIMSIQCSLLSHANGEEYAAVLSLLTLVGLTLLRKRTTIQMYPGRSRLPTIMKQNAASTREQLVADTM